jgi:hypothetical protein
MVHLLKSYPHIFSIQFEQLEPCGVRILLAASRQLDLQNVKNFFLTEISRDHANIDVGCVEIVQVEKVVKTLAGKEGLFHSGNSGERLRQ